MAQYLKPDCELGYIEDSAEIEKLKIDNSRHTILGCMLGDFDETGVYVVDPEIVKELIEMPKFIVETMDNIEICKSCLKLDKHISFMVTFEGNKASLILVEKLSYEANFAINSGTYSNINEYVLDVVETSGEINRNAIYMRWNIGNFDGDVLDIFNCDPEVLAKYFGIVNRFKYLLHANKILLDKEEAIEEAESSYTNEIFEILKRYPKLNAEVMAQINQTLEEKKNAISLNKPNFAKTFNELLENCIAHNLGVLTEDQLRDFLAEKRNAEVNLNIRRGEVFETEMVNALENGSVNNSPRIIRFKVDEAYTVRTVTELAEEFVSANKKIEERKRNYHQDPTTEKGKLIDALIAAGVDALIAGFVGATVGTAPGTLVAETAERINEVKQQGGVSKSGAKKTGGTKTASSAKKSGAGGKKAGAGGKKPSAAKKPATTKPSSGDNNRPLTRKEREALASEEREKRRQYGIYAGGGGGVTTSNNDSTTHEESPIERYEMSEEEVMAREKEWWLNEEANIIKGQPQAQNAAARRLLKNESEEIDKSIEKPLVEETTNKDVLGINDKQFQGKMPINPELEKDEAHTNEVGL